MSNVKIPDDFHITGNWLYHKSCLYINGKFSNYRHICTYPEVNNIYIDDLRLICNAYDKIEEITHFVDGKFNNLHIIVYSSYTIIIQDEKYQLINFNSLDEIFQYLQENYPECIRNNDIKIALKD